jgi:hypothetical protein
MHAREASMPPRWRKTKNTFFQRFHLCGAALAADKRLACEAFASARLRPLLLRESMRYAACRSGRILASHQPDCANLRELEAPFRRTRTRLRHRRNAFRTTIEGASIASDERAVGIRRAFVEHWMASVARGVRVENTLSAHRRIDRAIVSIRLLGGGRRRSRWRERADDRSVRGIAKAQTWQPAARNPWASAREGLATTRRRHWPFFLAPAA